MEVPQIRHHPPTLKISLREPSEQSHSILRYSAELRLQTWNANSTMPEVHVHTYCATDMPLVGKQKLKNWPLIFFFPPVCSDSRRYR